MFSNATTVTIGEEDRLQIAEQARQRLAALRARLSDARTPWSPEVASSLGSVQEMLEKLQADYTLLRRILDGTNYVVFAKRRDGRYVMINSEGAGILGKSVEDVLGRDDRALLKPEDAERIMATDRQVMASGETCTVEETIDSRKAPTTLLTTTSAWYDPRGELRGVIGQSHDITERRRAEREVARHNERLRSMASDLLLGEERERRSLAYELHDSLGQDIALAKMKLSALRQSASADLHEPLKGIERLIESADRSFRSITFQINPLVLHDLGLVPALEWLAESVSERFGLELQIVDGGQVRPADDRIRVVLFRAVRDLVLRAAEHGETNLSVVLRLVGDHERIHITIECGWTWLEIRDEVIRDDGLFSIHEQLKEVHASIRVDSAPGSRATVTITAPLGTAEG